MDATKEKKATSGHMSLMTVALNFFNVHDPRKKGFVATIIAYVAERKRQRFNEGGCRSAVNRVKTKERGESVGDRSILDIRTFGTKSSEIRKMM